MERTSTTNVGAVTLRRVIEDSQNPGGASGAIQFNDSTNFGGIPGSSWDGTYLDLPAPTSIGDDFHSWGGFSTGLAIAQINEGDYLLAGYFAGEDPSTVLPLGILINSNRDVFYQLAGTSGAQLRLYSQALDDSDPHRAYWILDMTPYAGPLNPTIELADGKAYGATSPLDAVPEIGLNYDAAYVVIQLIDTDLLGIYGSDDQATPADLLVSGLAGTGTAYVCADADGKLTRSATPCVM